MGDLDLLAEFSQDSQSRQSTQQYERRREVERDQPMQLERRTATHGHDWVLVRGETKINAQYIAHGAYIGEVAEVHSKQYANALG